MYKIIWGDQQRKIMVMKIHNEGERFTFFPKNKKSYNRSKGVISIPILKANKTVSTHGIKNPLWAERPKNYDLHSFLPQEEEHYCLGEIENKMS